MNMDIYDLSLASFLAIAFMFLAVFKPWLLLRPSFFVGGLMVLFLSLPAVFVDDVAHASTLTASNYNGYSRIEELRSLTVLFPFFILAWLGLSPGLSLRVRRLYKESRETWLSGSFNRGDYAGWWVWVAGLALYLAWYFSVQPLQNTGLWATFFNPANYDQARQASGSELPSISLKYAQAIMQSAVLPALFILTWQMKLTGRRRWIKYIFLLVLLLAASLTGARITAAVIIFAAAMVLLLFHGMTKKKRALAIVMAAFVCISAITAISYQRDKERSDIYAILRAVIGGRLLSTPFTTGPMTLSYVEKIYQGALNGANIRPWRLLIGSRYVNLPNDAYNYFLPYSPIKTGNLNTSFVFAYQAGLGLYSGWLLALLFLCLLDYPILLIISSGPPSPSRIAFQGALYVGLVSLVSTAFTTALLSGGLLPCLVMYYGLSKLESCGLGHSSRVGTRQNQAMMLPIPYLR